jgi:hypothetical protein
LAGTKALSPQAPLQPMAPAPSGRAGRDAALSKPRRLANRAAAASKSSPTRSPSLAAASPRAGRSSAQG